ncbi:hypothetical protein U1Q18_008459, partial [Sarracenia purpurea var. burkii]
REKEPLGALVSPLKASSVALVPPTPQSSSPPLPLPRDDPTPVRVGLCHCYVNSALAHSRAPSPWSSTTPNFNSTTSAIVISYLTPLMASLRHISESGEPPPPFWSPPLSSHPSSMDVVVAPNPYPVMQSQNPLMDTLMQDSANQQDVLKKSFREILMQPKIKDKYFDSDVEYFSNDDLWDEDIDQDASSMTIDQKISKANNGAPIVVIPKKLIMRARQQWMDCLILKLLKKSIGYKSC